MMLRQSFWNWRQWEVTRICLSKSICLFDYEYEQFCLQLTVNQ
jgi:hypothetical protein